MAVRSINFSDNYLILKQQEVSLVALVRMLWRSELEEISAVEYPEENKEENLKHRRVIIESLLIQKLIQSIAKPLAWFGSTLETWLNLLSSNQNLLMLFLNGLRGQVTIPDKESKKFSSFIGNLDPRVKLNETIKYGDNRYYPTLCMMASKISYENQAFVETTIKNYWKILEGERNKNEPWLLATIPRMVNALWELIRSFILPYKKGSEYTETWLLRLVRFVGLAVPCMADHNPHDYVNLTRLGSTHVYQHIF
ncbi:uncharacterized protein LOC110816738 [Carica papaya]|uniref:uncharacterized protein LOC110816738 n=1 Tax=Carica papaya TaxID=3649 RepID=UPI000B8CA55A|nr:uncharacterized protein LOC110816738 [Carica papaya]